MSEDNIEIQARMARMDAALADDERLARLTRKRQIKGVVVQIGKPRRIISVPQELKP